MPVFVLRGGRRTLAVRDVLKVGDESAGRELSATQFGPAGIPRGRLGLLVFDEARWASYSARVISRTRRPLEAVFPATPVRAPVRVVVVAWARSAARAVEAVTCGRPRDEVSFNR